MTGPSYQNKSYNKLKMLRSAIVNNSTKNESVCAVLDKILTLQDKKVAEKSFCSDLTEKVCELNKMKRFLSEGQLSQFRFHTMIFRRFIVFNIFFDVCPKDELPALFMELFTEVLTDLMEHAHRFQDIQKKYRRHDPTERTSLLLKNSALKEEVYEAYFNYILQTFSCFNENRMEMNEKTLEASKAEKNTEVENTDVKDSAGKDTYEGEEAGISRVDTKEAKGKKDEQRKDVNEDEEAMHIDEVDQEEHREETVDEVEKGEQLHGNVEHSPAHGRNFGEESDTSLPLISLEHSKKDNSSPSAVKRKKNKKTPRKRESLNSSIEDSISISDFANVSPLASSPTVSSSGIGSSRKRARMKAPLDIQKPIPKKERKIDKARLAEFMRSKDGEGEEIVTIEKGILWNSFEDDEVTTTTEDRKKSTKRRSKWTQEAEEALVAAVKKYGVGQWATILSDKRFSILGQRDNTQLKDKWRNMLKKDPRLGIYNS